MIATHLFLFWSDEINANDTHDILVWSCDQTLGHSNLVTAPGPGHLGVVTHPLVSGIFLYPWEAGVPESWSL